jgi:hypothetical protein
MLVVMVRLVALLPAAAAELLHGHIEVLCGGAVHQAQHSHDLTVTMEIYHTGTPTRFITLKQSKESNDEDDLSDSSTGVRSLMYISGKLVGGGDDLLW